MSRLIDVVFGTYVLILYPIGHHATSVLRDLVSTLPYRRLAVSNCVPSPVKVGWLEILKLSPRVDMISQIDSPVSCDRGSLVASQ